MTPRRLLNLEAAAFLVAACFLYHHIHGSWVWFALLFLSPDLGLLGYLVSSSVGARIYNALHTYSLPLTLMPAFALTGHAEWMPISVIWIAHIAFDRMVGYGLKYPSSFKETHLQRT